MKSRMRDENDKRGMEVEGRWKQAYLLSENEQGNMKEGKEMKKKKLNNSFQ